MTQIKFGTDGWRAIMAEEFTFGNVKIVTQAIANYVNKHQLNQRGIVIGYDNRFLSEKFADAVAMVLTGNGIKVYMTERAIPTPVTAFAIKMFNAGGAIMLTASHNPPEYNGIKFIPEYAGPALPYITDEIEDYVNEVLAQKIIKEISKENATQQKLVRVIDPLEDYLKHLREIIDVERIRAANLKVVVDPMYGAGIGYLETFLIEAGCDTTTLHSYRDPLFGGSLPEPSAKVLVELKEQVIKSKADLGLAMDGDADRFGIIDRDGTYITPNQVLSLLYYHLVKYKNWRGPVARTVATTHLLDRIAEKYSLEVDETPVGFKYIGQSMMEKGSILGGEESGGLSIKGHIPEKDGILATALIAEIVSVYNKSIGEILNEIYNEFGMLVNERLDVHCSEETKARVLKTLKDLSPPEIAGKKVMVELDIDGKKFVMEDGSWVLIRPSGTEPLFRIYAESANGEMIRKIQESIRSILDI